MRVAVVSAAVPFARGGAELLEEGIVDHLRRRDIDVLHVRLPFVWSTTDDVRRAMAAAAAIELPRSVDVMLPLKFPAWLVRHPNTVAWVFHQFRQVYDLWELGASGYDQDDPRSWSLKADVTRIDTDRLGAARAVHVYSPVTADRLQRYNGLSSSLLHSPMPLTTEFHREAHGDCIVALGRVSRSKRQHLAIEAVASCRRPVRLVIAGLPDSVEYDEEIRQQIVELGVGNRVTYLPRFITEDEKVALLSTALASVVVPVDEDNFGYVTAESFLADRPVLTMSDSGGVRWLVDDETGFVCRDAESLAEAMDALYDDRRLAARLGGAGRERLEAMDLTWDRTIDRLLT